LEIFQKDVEGQSETLSDLLKSLKEKEKEKEARIGNDVKILQGQLWAKDLDLVSLEKQLGAALARNEDLGYKLAQKEEQLEQLEQQTKIKLNFQHSVKKQGQS